MLCSLESDLNCLHDNTAMHVSKVYWEWAECKRQWNIN